MQFRENLWLSIKQFFAENGMDRSCVLAYYSIISTLFLLTFFTFLFTRFLGHPDITIRTVYPFSPDFFSKISPDIFSKAEDLSTKLKDIGNIGILISFLLGFIIFRKVIQYVNDMFYIKVKTGFMARRIREFGLMSLIGILVVISFFLTGLISTVTTLFNKNEIVAKYLNPSFVIAVNNFLIKYLAPSLITFLLFLILYKWIPEKKVHWSAALTSAFFSTLLWEILKRAYAYYLVNISIFGKIKGPIIAVILFGFWMEISMSIMLFGAKFAYILDRKKNGHTEGNS